MLSAVKDGPFTPTEGAEPTVIRVAVIELVVMVLAVIELVVAASRNTFDALISMDPDGILKKPEEFRMVLVARMSAV